MPAASDLQVWICSSPRCATYQQEKQKKQQFTAADTEEYPSLQWSYTEKGLPN